MTDLRDLDPIGKRLNASTDEFNAVLETIQNKLNALALGVEAWLDDGNHELARAVVGRRTELDGHPVSSWRTDESEFVTMHRIVEVDELGYGRLGDGWALLVRTVRFSEVKRGHGWDMEQGEEAVEDERKPLLRSARHLRVKAIDAMPALIDKLHAEASRVIEAVEKAKRIAESIK